MTRAGGNLPQHPSLQDRVRTSRAVVRAQRARRVPLPEREDGRPWHPLTVAWWDTVWESGVTQEWTTADVQTAFRVARMDDAFWRSTEPLAQTKLSAAIGAASRLLGLDPMSRRTLQWTIDEPAEAPAPAPARAPTRDPRLAVVPPSRPARRRRESA